MFLYFIKWSLLNFTPKTLLCIPGMYFVLDLQMQSIKDVFPPPIELGKDASTTIRAKFVKKKERPGTTKKVVGFQRMKVAGDDPNAKMKGYLHKVCSM